MLPVQYAEQGMCNSGASVSPSVCSIVRQPPRRAAGLLLSVPYAGHIDRQPQQQRRRSTGPQHGVQQQMRTVSC